jgi:hypothetical protein
MTHTPFFEPTKQGIQIWPRLQPSVSLSFSTYQARVMEKTINLHKQK